MFLIAFSYTKAIQEWGRAVYSSWQSFWKLKFMKNQALELHSLCQSRSKYARKEQWRRGKQSEENRGQQLQSSFALLEHFPKSIFYMIYTISKLRKLRIKRFKPCTICSWNEEDMAFGRQLHQAEGQFRTLRNWNSSVGNLKWMAAVHSRWSPTCEINLRDFHKSPCNVRNLHANWDIYAPTLLDLFFRYFCINFHSSPCNPRTMRFFN